MATNGVNGHSDGLASVKDFVSEDFDYVVIGGGTAGLCVVSDKPKQTDRLPKHAC